MHHVNTHSFPSGYNSDSECVKVDKLYLLLPNHKCMFKKDCPFHAPEEKEEAGEEEEKRKEEPPQQPPIYSKRRAMSLASAQDHAFSQEMLAKKLTKINEDISSSLVQGNRLNVPRKTSQDISLPDFEPLRKSLDLRSNESLSVSVAASTREQSVVSEVDSSCVTMDSGFAVESSLCSDREDSLMEEEEVEREEEEEEEVTKEVEELSPFLEEELVIPDVAELDQMM